jgi:hypothetical protein
MKGKERVQDGAKSWIPMCMTSIVKSGVGCIAYQNANDSQRYVCTRIFIDETNRPEVGQCVTKSLTYMPFTKTGRFIRMQMLSPAN